VSAIRRTPSTPCGGCPSNPYPCDLVTPLPMIVVFILVLVVLGADPSLALGSFAGIAAAAMRLSRG
jgi:hypothetical protein